MTLEMIREFLGWCSVINFGLLMFSFIIMWARRQMIYQIHSRMFSITEGQFTGIMYILLGVFKILVFVFNIVPYLALCIMMD